MAATFSSLHTIFSLILLLRLLSPQPTKAAIVDNVCTQTREPPLCSSSLQTDTRSPTTQLPQLAQITNDLAQYQAITTKMKIHFNLLQAKDQTLRALFVQRENFYFTAPGQLKAHHYGTFAQGGARVRGTVDGCAAAFNNNSPFKNENRVVGVLGDAIVVIAKNL